MSNIILVDQFNFISKRNIVIGIISIIGPETQMVLKDKIYWIKWKMAKEKPS